MAKKEQKIVITDKELTPTIIGKLNTKEKSPVLLLFIFAIFVAVAIFLPDIQNYIDNMLFNKQTNQPTTNAPINNNEEKPADENEITYYDYDSDLVITNDLFTISNIRFENNTMTFDMKNNINEELKLNTLKYFVELYTSDTTLLQRIKISFGSLAKNETKQFSYDIDENTINNLQKILLIEKTENDYPEVNLQINKENNGVLTCTKGYETITYTFGNDYLISINDLINYPFENNITYANNLQNYQILAATYNNYDGVSSTIVTLDTGFTFTTLIDLRTADITGLENNNYYAYRTLSKTVKFETESNGFSCN